MKIALAEMLFPIERRAHDEIEIVMLRLPIHFRHRDGGIGDDQHGIVRPAAGKPHREILARHGLACLSTSKTEEPLP